MSMNSTGSRIKKLREMKFPGHGGQTECAKALGIRRQELSRWENGGANPSRKKLTQIAEVFGVTLEELRGESKSPDAPTPGGTGEAVDAAIDSCLALQAALSVVVLQLTRERNLEPYRKDLEELADTAQSLQGLLSKI